VTGATLGADGKFSFRLTGSLGRIIRRGQVCDGLALEAMPSQTTATPAPPASPAPADQ
jgi:hypothetical protein